MHKLFAWIITQLKCRSKFNQIKAFPFLSLFHSLSVCDWRKYIATLSQNHANFLGIILHYFLYMFSMLCTIFQHQMLDFLYLFVCLDCCFVPWGLNWDQRTLNQEAHFNIFRFYLSFSFRFGRIYEWFILCEKAEIFIKNSSYDGSWLFTVLVPSLFLFISNKPNNPFSI